MVELVVHKLETHYELIIKTVNETAEKFMGHFIDKVSCLVDAELERCLPPRLFKDLTNWQQGEANRLSWL